VNATVEIAPSVENQKKGKIEDYQEIPGYLLIKKPGHLRLIGLVPVVRTRLFDMVSDGQQFKLSIPPKNKFVEGTSEVTHVSQSAIENIRPQAILDALLLPEIDPKNDIAVVRSGTEHVQDLHDRKKLIELPTYVLEIIKHASDHWYISRSIVISRIDLKPHVQQIYDAEGNVVTEATYENFTNIDGISFPYLIRILRPKEQYEINIAITKLRLNQPLTDDQFQLKQPEGSQLQVLK
jgi:outer membrane lipoprotein-sorting protein